MKKDGIPFKIMEYLSLNQNTDYGLSTEDMASQLDMPTARFRNELNKLRKGLEEPLGLKGSLKLIESKRFNGYRINPQIEIVEMN